jgi:hypothetical protein
MKLKLLLSILAVTLCASSVNAIEILQADTNDTGGFFDSAAIPAKLIKAKHEFNEKNMRGALIIYREILEIEAKNTTALYWTARCHYDLKKYSLAKNYLDKTLAENPKAQDNIDFFYGKIHHRLAELDLAIESYQKFLDENGNKNSLDVEDAKQYIAQCRYAKEMMQHPVNVEIKNMGTEVNSRFDEYAPAVTANGQRLYFTSRRSTSVGGDIDEGGDYKFFEDVYYTEWSEEKNMWSNSRGVEGEVNSPTYDAILSISPDGNQMYVYRNNQNSAGDIFVAGYDVHEEEWRAPVKMPKPVNTSYFESSVSITQDGEVLYFVSERPEGQGQGDIYMSKKGNGETWNKPENLGLVINTELDEKFVFIHPNGKALYFASNGHQTLGSYDIFRSEFVNGQWSIPVNLGYPINTVNEESTFSLTSNNKDLFIAAEYADALGERDIYQIDVSNYPLVAEGYDKSSYGTLILTVKDVDGEPLKNAVVQIYLTAGSGRVLVSEKTDKLGLLRVNLPGGVTYTVKAEAKKMTTQMNVEIKLNDEGETVVKETLQFK